MFRRQYRSGLVSLGVAIALGLMLSTAAWANSWPPMAIYLLNVPLMAGLVSYGLVLVAIAFLEAFILSKRESLPLPKSILCSIGANITSLLMGFLFVITLSSLPYTWVGWLFFGGLCSLLVWFSWMAVPYLQFNHIQLPKLRFGLRLGSWTGIWSLLLLGSFWLLGNIGRANPRVPVSVSFDANVPLHINILQLLAVILFILIGFAVSVVSEGFSLRRSLPQSSSTLWMTAVVMNVRSYIYLALPVTVLMMSR